jgi:ABC-type phosphate/phosphonate transport system substrate-binding protein
MKTLLFSAALLTATPAAAQAATLRIAVPAPATAPCKAAAGQGSPAERAYRELLAKRLEVEVLDCPVVGAAGAAQALAAGQVDLAVLDPAAFAPVAAKVRAILTLRPRGGLSRVPVVLATRADAARKSVKDLKGGRLVFGGDVPSALALPRWALADQGMGPDFFGKEEIARTAEDAVASLRAGRADAMALNAEAWQRICRGNTPKEKPCADLQTAWRGRPRAAAAVAVRRDMPDQLRYRLIGIHVAMHLEAPEAFAAASAFAPGGEDFEPAEADALSPAMAAP